MFLTFTYRVVIVLGWHKNQDQEGCKTKIVWVEGDIILHLLTKTLVIDASLGGKRHQGRFGPKTSSQRKVKIFFVIVCSKKAYRGRKTRRPGEKVGFCPGCELVLRGRAAVNGLVTSCFFAKMRAQTT